MKITARKLPHITEIHGQKLTDNYHWLRDQNWPKVENEEILTFLKSENLYTEEFFKPLQVQIDNLYKQMLGRIKLADRSVAIKRSDKYHYFNITTETGDYPIHARIKSDGTEEIILDQNKESAGHNFYKIGAMSISPNGILLAYSEDTSGDEHFKIKVKNLSSWAILSDSIVDVIGGIVWDKNSSGFYYAKLNDKWRADKIYYHTLGTTQDQDVLILEEADHIFRLNLAKSSSEEYIFLYASSKNSTEVSFIRADDASRQAHQIIARREDHLCHINHIHTDFYISTNDMGKNFRLVKLPVRDYRLLKFSEMIAHSADKYLVDFNLYNNNLVVVTTELGLPIITFYSYDLTQKDSVSFPDPAYSASLKYSCRDDDGALISYSSLNTPNTVFKYEFAAKNLVTIKTQEIPSGYDKDLYKTERLMIATNDAGVKVPASLVYKKDLFKKDGSNPLFLYGYGSYGHAIPPGFSSNIISLLDAGFVYAIAHIRGGDDLGFEWYESAKFLTKKRSFDDFISVADHLVAQHYTRVGNIVIEGGSAGGMLIGVAINQRPELFKAAIADVPFVDVLNTMLDDTLPLTPGEFKEWGNPQEKNYFDYIKSYSPYENIKQQPYPSLYVLAGLNDPRVTYWEPAKYVAKLREYKTDRNILLLETEMEAGHGGRSSRFDRIKEVAKKYAFIFHEFFNDKTTSL